MTWKFDYLKLELFFAVSGQDIVDGLTDFGDEVTSDLGVDMGDRENDNSQIDMGLRIIEGN
jgi:hypothetical protein